jgi:DNA-binding NtrC family response regulator
MSARASLAAARRDFEERYVRAALARSGGRVIIAARELGVSRQGLRKLTARLGLDAAEKAGALE